MIECALCKKNGETEDFYRSHKLRDENNKVTCPVLKEFTCPLCQKKGDHTSSYCPKGKESSIIKKSPSAINRREESRAKFQHMTSSKTTIGTNIQQLVKRQVLASSQPKFKLAPSLPDAGVGSAKNLELLLSVANKMHILQRLAYLQFHGYNWDRYLALQTIINRSFILI